MKGNFMRMIERKDIKPGMKVLWHKLDSTEKIEVVIEEVPHPHGRYVRVKDASGNRTEAWGCELYYIEPIRTLETLGELNRRLTALLADPQPGMVSWMTFLHEVTKEIGMYSGER